MGETLGIGSSDGARLNGQEGKKKATSEDVAFFRLIEERITWQPEQQPVQQRQPEQLLF